MAVELEKAKKEIRQIDAEADRRGKISGLFCKAHDHSANLLQPSGQGLIPTEPVVPTRLTLGVPILGAENPGPELLLPLTER